MYQRKSKTWWAGAGGDPEPPQAQSPLQAAVLSDRTAGLGNSEQLWHKGFTRQLLFLPELDFEETVDKGLK